MLNAIFRGVHVNMCHCFKTVIHVGISTIYLAILGHKKGWRMRVGFQDPCCISQIENMMLGIGQA